MVWASIRIHSFLLPHLLPRCFSISAMTSAIDLFRSRNGRTTTSVSPSTSVSRSKNRHQNTSVVLSGYTTFACTSQPPGTRNEGFLLQSFTWATAPCGSNAFRLSSKRCLTSSLQGTWASAVVASSCGGVGPTSVSSNDGNVVCTMGSPCETFSEAAQMTRGGVHTQPD